MLTLSGCSMVSRERVKLKDLEMTILSEEVIAQELMTILDEKKEKAFQFTYTDKEYLYICIGYGEQKSGGYSIAVQELYETQNAVYVHTNLLGPTEEEAKKQAPSWPHVVVITQKKDKTVVFD